LERRTTKEERMEKENKDHGKKGRRRSRSAKININQRVNKQKNNQQNLRNNKYLYSIKIRYDNHLEIFSTNFLRKEICLTANLIIMIFFCFVSLKESE